MAAPVHLGVLRLTSSVPGQAGAAVTSFCHESALHCLSIREESLERGESLLCVFGGLEQLLRLILVWSARSGGTLRPPCSSSSGAQNVRDSHVSAASHGNRPLLEQIF
jgi:hypothetical protein